MWWRASVRRVCTSYRQIADRLSDLVDEHHRRDRPDDDSGTGVVVPLG